MFSSLIESGSHRVDLKRKGSFLLGTFVFYSLMLVVAGVGSIYAFNANIEEENEIELVALLRFAPVETRTEPEVRRASPKPAAASETRQQISTVREVVRDTPYLRDRPVASEDTPVLPAHVPYRIGDTNNIVPPSLGTHTAPGTGSFSGINNGGGDDGPVLKETEAAPMPPPARVKPTPAPQPTPATTPKQTISVPSSVLSGKAVFKPAPAYPEIAKRASAAGTVAVQILVDERGNVVSAQPTNGPLLLQQAAQQAALRARFTPTILNGTPVKVSGVIYYNFVLR